MLTHSLALSVNELIKQEHSTLEWIPELAESYEIFPMAYFTFHPRIGVNRQNSSTFASSYVQGEP